MLLKLHWNEKKITLQLSASSLSANKFQDAAYVFTHEFTCQNCEQGGRKTRLNILECDQKLDQAPKMQSLRNLFPKVLSQVEHKVLQSRLLLEQLRSLPLTWLILHQNETERTCLWLPSPPQWVFYPYCRSSVRPSGLRAYADVITKFSGIDRFPFSFKYRATLGTLGARADATGNMPEIELTQLVKSNRAWSSGWS